MLAMAALKPTEVFLNFGKYKGCSLSSLPDDYLLWMSLELQSKWRGLAIQALNQRITNSPDSVLDSDEQKLKSTTAALLIFPFGRFKGQSLGSMHEDHLQGIASEHKFSPWGKLAQQVLHERKPELVPNVVVQNSEFFKQQMKLCEESRDLEEAKRIDEILAGSLYSKDRFLSNMLVGLYGKCGSVEDAKRVFDGIVEPNIFSWNMMLKSYTQNGYLREAWKFFDELPEKNVVSWNIMLAALSREGEKVSTCNLHEVKRLFARIPEPDAVSWTILLTACINNGQLQEARYVFDHGISPHSAFSYNAMIEGYARYGYLSDAEELFKACPYEKTVASWNVMIWAFGSNGYVEEARKLFDEAPTKDQASWNAMLAGYAVSGELEQARKLFEQMKTQDEVSWRSLVLAHCKTGDMEGATSLVESKKLSGVHHLMVEGWFRAGGLEAARKYFEDIPQEERDVETLSCLIQAYTAEGYVEEALAMKRSDCGFNETIDTSSLNLMISASSLGGDCKTAAEIFKEIQQQEQLSFYSWTALITGYVQNGLLNEAMHTFREMVLQGIEPNRVTLTWMLSSLGRNYGAEECRTFFSSIPGDYGSSHTVEHYECMLDSLGRAKRVAEALELVKSMPFEPDVKLWMVLLEGCRVHGDLESGKIVAESVLELDPNHLLAYSVLAEMYSREGKKKELTNLRKLVKDKVEMMREKSRGASDIEIGKLVHRFQAGDTSHPWDKRIRSELRKLNKLMKESHGYVVQKDELVSGRGTETHGEKLAVAYGNLKSGKNERLRILDKGIRMCSDCHRWTKLASKLTAREIVIRDSHHVHHFVNGACSCRDFL